MAWRMPFREAAPHGLDVVQVKKAAQFFPLSPCTPCRDQADEEEAEEEKPRKRSIICKRD
jgi:hypothetical protein